MKEISLDICAMVAKKGCKHCGGRGYIDINYGSHLQYLGRDYCKCTRKKAAEIRELSATYRNVLESEGENGGPYI